MLQDDHIGPPYSNQAVMYQPNGAVLGGVPYKIVGSGELIHESKTSPDGTSARSTHKERIIQQQIVVGPSSKEQPWRVVYDDGLPPLQPVWYDDEEDVYTTENKNILLMDSLEDDENNNWVALMFRDGNGEPIKDLEISIEMPNKNVLIGKTNEQGAENMPLPAKKEERKGAAIIKVKTWAGQMKEVAVLALEQLTHSVILSSQKVIHDLTMRSHNQKPETNKAKQDKKPTTEKTVKTVNDKGNPTTKMQVPETCINDGKNLLLGGNQRYRAIIIEAAERVGLEPQAICALIECEAVHFQVKVQVLDKNGKPILQTKGKNKGKQLEKVVDEYWNAESGKGRKAKEAQGLTQFMGRTWLGSSVEPGYLRNRCVEKGWVRLNKGHYEFVLNDKQGVLKPTLKQHGDNANVKAFLEKRLDPEWSINAAADYAKDNLKKVEKEFNLKDLTDMEKAKVMYLMHHEGPGAGPAFIKNKLLDFYNANYKAYGDYSNGTEALTAVFKGQGMNVFNYWMKQKNNALEESYRAWLCDFIDKKFEYARTNFFCEKPKDEFTKAGKILSLIGGKEAVYD